MTIAEYEVDSSLKEHFMGEKGQLLSDIKMKVKDVEMAYIQDSFKIKYARYLEFKPNTEVTNVENMVADRKGAFPTVGHIVLMTHLLCYFKLNFVNLSYGNEFDFGSEIEYNIPIEFVLGKNEIEKKFKFFLKYDSDNIEGHKEIVIYFQLCKE